MGAAEGGGGPVKSSSFDALDLVLDIHVQLAETVYLVLACIPVATTICLQEGGHQLAEAVGVEVHHALCHLWVVDECVVGLIIHPVVNLRARSRFSHRLGKLQLRDLTMNGQMLVNLLLISARFMIGQNGLEWHSMFFHQRTLSRTDE